MLAPFSLKNVPFSAPSPRNTWKKIADTSVEGNLPFHADPGHPLMCPRLIALMCPRLIALILAPFSLKIPRSRITCRLPFAPLTKENVRLHPHFPPGPERAYCQRQLRSILFRRGSFVGTLDSFWLPFGRFWHPFGSILNRFGSIFGQKSCLLVPFPQNICKKSQTPPTKEIFLACMPLRPGHVRTFASGNFD